MTLQKPETMPQEVWESKDVDARLWWIRNIDKRGSYEAVVEWRRTLSSQKRGSKLTAKDIQAIRSSDKTLSILANKYGVSESYISKIKTGKRL